MSKAAVSIRVFGIYLFFLGIGFIFIPNTLLKMFGLPVVTDVWIRFMGVLLFILGYYYVRTAPKEQTLFFQLTVHGRLIMVAGFIAFVAFGLVKPIVLLFGAVDFSSAIWTAFALRSK